MHHLGISWHEQALTQARLEAVCVRRQAFRQRAEAPAPWSRAVRLQARLRAVCRQAVCRQAVCRQAVCQQAV